MKKWINNSLMNILIIAFVIIFVAAFLFLTGFLSFNI